MRNHNHGEHPEVRDYGGEPFVFNINHAATMNQSFRTTLWSGKDLQLTLMSIPAGESIGVEMHPDVDQFIRIVSGRGKVYMGCSGSTLSEKAVVDGSDAVLIPGGTWHNIVNIGSRPLKLYSLYAPPNHKRGTVHHTKEDAEKEEH